MKTASLATPALAVGMILQAHGSRFRLTEAATTEAEALFIARCEAEAAFHFCPDDVAHVTESWVRNITLRAFRTEYLGPTSDGACEAIPTWQRANWIIQGNHRAFWAVEVEA